MNLKKFLFIVGFLVTFSLLFNFNAPAAKAITAAEIQALIQQLQQQVLQLQQELAKIKATCHTSSLWSWDYCGPDCKCDAGEGDCDSNNECSAGYCALDVGANYGQSKWIDVCEGKTVTGSLAVALAVDNPAGQLVPGSSVNLLKFSLTAGVAEDVSVYRIRFSVKKDGGDASAQPEDINNFKLYKEATLIASANLSLSDDAYQVDFSDISVAVLRDAIQTLTLKADIPIGTTASSMKVEFLDLSAKGATSGKEIYPKGSAVSNWLAVSLVKSSIVVISPNGGESLEQGKAYQIKWRAEYWGADDVRSGVHVYLLGCSDSACTEQYCYYLTGFFDPRLESYSWTVSSTDANGKSIPSGSCYRIEIINSRSISLDVPEIKDQSDGCFNIQWTAACHTTSLWSLNYCSSACKCFLGEGDCDTDADCTTGYCARDVGASYGQDPSMDVCEEKIPSSITVISPNGGEQRERGKTYNIIWAASGYASTDKISVAVVDYADGDNLVKYDIVYNLAANAESYSWTIPSDFSVGSKYKIKVEICDSSKCYSDQSNNYFSIIAGGSGFRNIEDQLADISKAIAELAETIKALMGK